MERGMRNLLLLSFVCVVWSKCRMHPDATHKYCGLPEELSNFQGNFECDDRVKIAKPRSIADLQRIVRHFSRVKAVGVGHSFWKEQFCSGEDENAVNVVMTELPSVLSLVTRNGRSSIDTDFPIEVDEDNWRVTVAAGVSQRILLDYLATYRSHKAPNGWILPTFSWFIDQTVGGAVATGSHGSSIRYGSLSNIVVSLRAVLADGSLINVSRETDPHLFNAFSVSVGRLGILTDITLKIVPQKLHERRALELSFDAFVVRMKKIQDRYRKAKAMLDAQSIDRALRPIDETQAFWFAPTSEVWMVHYQTVGREVEVEPRIQAYSFDNVQDQEAKRNVHRNIALLTGTRFFSNMLKASLRPRVQEGIYDTRKAYLTMSERKSSDTTTPLYTIVLTEMNVFHSGFSNYDQYEVSVPMESFADCLGAIGSEIYGRKDLWKGFVTPMLIRFVSEEAAYLSNTNGGPRVYINLEDYLSYNTGKKNWRFHRVIELFRKQCQGRLHWGKAGWSQYASCFDGKEEYPDSWCDFGCAAMKLDPTGKFRGVSDIWQWKAKDKYGYPIAFDRCCTRNGFDRNRCSCVSRDDC